MTEPLSITTHVDKKVGKRLTLTTIFAITFISVLLVFSSVTALNYYRLIDFREILDQIAQTSLPNVVVLEQLNNNISALSAISDGLSNARSEPSLRIAETQIENKISEIKLLAEQQVHDKFMFAQLNAISQELYELRELASQRLDIELQLNEREKLLYALNDQVTNLASQVELSAENIQLRQIWRSEFFKAVAIVSKSLHVNRLQTIRQLSIQVSAVLQNLYNQTNMLPLSQREQFHAFSQQLDNTLFAKNGLFPLRITLLRLSGRVTGRGNFVHNLIIDYSRLLNFKSYQLSDSVIRKTRLTSQRVRQQIQFMSMIMVAGLVLLVLVVLFIHKRVVQRLVTLNNLVQDRAIGQPNSQKIFGNDEISDIADTFEQFAVTIEQQKQSLRTLSLLDGLTGIPNRRALDETLAHELHIAMRHKWPVSLLMIDIDYFKAYNDNYGHIAGDAALKKVAQILAKELPRSTDFVARYGGEEFVCILPDTSLNGAVNVGHSLLEQIRATNIEHRHNPDQPYLTISIGVATSNIDDTPEASSLQKFADHALYAAKQQGRNRVVSYSHLNN